MKNEKKSFTIIELLVIISIIGLLSSVVLVYTRGQIEKARDTRRISDMKQIQKGLEIYFDRNGKYPEPEVGDGEGCMGEDCPQGGWDVGNISMPIKDTFIQPLVTEGIFGKVPIETVGNLSSYNTYRYHRYAARPEVCGGRVFYVLAAWLNNSQYSYGVNDEIDPCYTPFSEDTDGHWYVIMGIE